MRGKRLVVNWRFHNIKIIEPYCNFLPLPSECKADLLLQLHHLLYEIATYFYIPCNCSSNAGPYHRNRSINNYLNSAWFYIIFRKPLLLSQMPFQFPCNSLRAQQIRPVGFLHINNNFIPINRIYFPLYKEKRLARLLKAQFPPNKRTQIIQIYFNIWHSFHLYFLKLLLQSKFIYFSVKIGFI